MAKSEEKISHNNITKSAALKVMDKIMAAKDPLAVFVKGGSWRSTKATTKLFSEAMRKTPGELMGVYDCAALIEWLENDLDYMGVR